jgi:hypothetical protein
MAGQTIGGIYQGRVSDFLYSFTRGRVEPSAAQKASKMMTPSVVDVGSPRDSHQPMSADRALISVNGRALYLVDSRYAPGLRGGVQERNSNKRLCKEPSDIWVMACVVHMRIQEYSSGY